MSTKYFKLCQRCERFFYSEDEYRSHSCVSSQANAVRKNDDESKKTPRDRSGKRDDMLRMKKELEDKGVKLPVTATYETTLEAYQKEFGKK